MQIGRGRYPASFSRKLTLEVGVKRRSTVEDETSVFIEIELDSEIWRGTRPNDIRKDLMW